MKKVVWFVCFCLGGLPITGQVYSENDWENYIPHEIYPKENLDVTKLCVQYLQTFRYDRSDTSRAVVSEMILQIGEKLSKYSNYTLLSNDSIVEEEMNSELTIADIISASVERTYEAGDRTMIYKNYPPGKISVQNNIFRKKYVYEEPIPYFDWKIEADSLCVAGYMCRKAVGPFRGRLYTVWFTPQIPINNGPWKLCGLPGLILKAEDAEGAYTFEAFSVYEVSWNKPVYRPVRRGEIRTTREKFLRFEKETMQNLRKRQENIQAIYSLKSKPARSRKSAYNPIELE